MKQKEGRDYISLNDCVVVLEDGVVRLSGTGETFRLSLAEFNNMVKFVTLKQKGSS